MNSIFTDIQIIVAVAKNNAIGKDGAMPWHYPEDLKFFKNTTSGKPVIMGRKTFESIGKALPHRKNYVISSNLDLGPNVVVCSDLEEAIENASSFSTPVFVIGGSRVYKEALAIANTVWITRIPKEIKDADTFFPKLPSEFKLDETLDLGAGLIVEKWVDPHKAAPLRKAPVHFD